MRRFNGTLFQVTAVVGMVLCAFVSRPAFAADPPVDYARDVLPILSDNCYHCHGPDEKARKAKLRLDTKDGAFRVKDGVAVLTAGKPEASELVKRITSADPDEVMPPPDGVRKLTPAQVDTLKRWVSQGARWGTHWAFVPPVRPPVPTVKRAHWPANDVDRFILAKLEAEGLTPQTEADRYRLIRRASFDLTGLPPTPAETDAFVADRSPNAYEKVIDRLLASPRYGERMAADWLDVARFADTQGFQVDRPRPVWPYRDWVIKAFNANQPFDQFATWQLAGDLLPPGRTATETRDQTLATAFNRLHMQTEEGGVVEEEFRVGYVVDRVNTFGTAFLGMTFECARCHDHKFDPVSQKDVYGLFAMFQNIDESGQTSFFTNSTPVPAMLLTTDEQDAKLAELEKAVTAAEARAIRARAAAVDRATREPRGSAPGLCEWNGPLLASLLPPTPRTGAGPLVPLRPSDGPYASDLPGCVGRYPLDAIDAKGQIVNAIDASKPGKAIESPAVAEGRAGAKASQLAGENGFTFPGVGKFTKADPFTLSMWIRPAELTARQVLIHQSAAPIDAGSRGIEVLLEGGKVAFGLHHMWPGDSAKVTTAAAPVKANEWAHVAVTYDGSGRAGGMAIYVDGDKAKLDVVRDGLVKDSAYGSEPDFAVGYRFRDTGFKGGRVADVRIFGRQLCEPEAAHLAGKIDLAKSLTAMDDVSRKAAADYYASAISPEVTAAQKALRDARKARNDFVTALPDISVMKEMPTPKPAYVLIRGNYDQHGEAVSAGTPAALSPFPANQPKNRLGLAHWLFDPSHPLTARVTVNRLWQQMFGRGIVETADNFGSTGSVPTHPELLDFLARTFVDDFRWDQKRFLKYIAMSATYRQSTKASADALAKDAQNSLLSHAPARRLTAEMLRDQALAAGGLLVDKIGGPSVKPYQPAGLWEIAMNKPNYDQGHGDDLYRRSVYTFVKRTVAPPSLLTFDAGDRSLCSVRRQSTSTPLQALALLNDVQVVEAARKVAERAIRDGGPDDVAKAAYAFRLVTDRPPTDREAAVLGEMLAGQRAIFAADKEAVKQMLAMGESKPDPKLNAADVAAYGALAQALFSHDEAVMRR